MFGGAVELMEQASKLLAEVDHDFVDGGTRCAAIADVRRVLDQLECQWLLMVGQADRREDAPVVGNLTTTAMLKHKVSMSHGAASRAVGFARKLHKLSRTAAAFAAGEITAHHAAVIVEAYTPKRAEALDALEATFVEQAATLSPDDLRNAIKYVTDAIDGDGGAAEFMDQYEARRFDIAKTFNGTVVGRFALDPETGTRALTVFNWLYNADASDQSGEHERPRTPTQRRANAFRTMLGIIQDNPELVSVGTHSRRHPPHILNVVDVEVLERRACPELAATVRAEAANVGRLSAETLRRMSCDAAISRVVTDGPSQVLDVGRKTRTITTAMRNAVIVRDKHCTEPGCDRGPGFCQVHHDDHWTNGGETKIDNLKLRCDRHHIDDHEGTHARYRKPDG